MKSSFQNPPDDARVMMRWWWFGPAVTNDELTRELRAMKAGGIGGVEIQAVYPLSLDDSATGIQNLPYLSAGHLSALKHTNEEAHALGLRVDLTLGSGWPFGGPSVSIDQAAGQLRVEHVKLVGGEQSVPVPRSDKGESLLAAFLARVNSKMIAVEGTRELTDIKDGKVSLPTDLSGATEVLFFFASRTNQQVKRASVGAEGLVLDHYDRGALDSYLEHVGKPLLQAFGDKPPYAIFCDSLEVFDSDWTPDLLAEFKKRRGYDLKPYLPALVGDFGPRTGEIRRDWGQTLTELLSDHFVRPLREWANAHGTRFRFQGYGLPPATVSTSRLADLPEGEGFDWKVLSPARWASSTSHLYGRPVTSSETWTWLNTPAFRATPLDMKAEADLHFLQGINQLIGHGWPYSPPGAEYPGWRFYAAGALDDKNPWWIVMPDLMRYLQRTSYILRQGQPANDVAFYLPNNDAWAAFRNKDVHMIEVLRKQIGDDLMGKIFEAGFNLDFFDDEALRDAGKVEDGALALGGNKYKIVILPNVERLPLATLKTLADFVTHGGTLIATRRLPDKAPGWQASDSESQEVRETVHGLFEGNGARARLVTNEKSDLVEALQAALQPDVRFSDRQRNLGFVHRYTPEADIYFIANTSAEECNVKATFRTSGSRVESWNLFDGTMTPLVGAPEQGGGVTIPLELAPYDSRVIVISNNAGALATNASPKAAASDSPPVEISDGWRISFEKGPSVMMDTLKSWTDDEATRFYSGVATYERDVAIPAGYLKPGAVMQLDLGPAKALPAKRLKNGFRAWVDAPVREAAVVYVNDQRAGAVRHPPYQVDITKLLRPGLNRLKIVVGNSAINQLAGQHPPDYKALNKKYGERFKPQDMENLQPMASGLTGPIRLLQNTSHP